MQKFTKGLVQITDLLLKLKKNDSNCSENKSEDNSNKETDDSKTETGDCKIFDELSGFTPHVKKSAKNT